MDEETRENSAYTAMHVHSYTALFSGERERREGGRGRLKQAAATTKLT